MLPGLHKNFDPVVGSHKIKRRNVHREIWGKNPGKLYYFEDGWRKYVRLKFLVRFTEGQG